MWIIIDKRIPEAAKATLRRYGNLIEFESENVVYDAISGHPDIFICQTDRGLIIAPNSPIEFVKSLNDCNIKFTFGKHSLGNKYPETAHYNAVVTSSHLIHNLKTTDPTILETVKDKKQININQAYTRCNVTVLNDSCFITSDRGIEKSLQEKHLKVLYVDPNGIKLPGFSNGFFGGCCGVADNKLFIIGSLKYVNDRDSVKGFVMNAGLTIVELYDGPLFDGGGIFFV